MGIHTKKIQCSVIIFVYQGWKNTTILQLIRANPCQVFAKNDLLTFSPSRVNAYAYYIIK